MKTTALAKRQERLRRLAYLLFVPSAVTIAILARVHDADITAALERRSVPFGRFLIGVGYGLGLLVGVPAFLAIGRRVSRLREQPSPDLYVFTPFLFLVLSLGALWLHVFNRPDFRLVFLLLWFAPVVVLLDLEALRGQWALGLRFPTRSRSGIANVFIAIMALQLVTLVLEMSFRLVTGVRPISHDAYGTRTDFVLQPYLMFGEPSVHEGGTLNTQGFEGHELDLGKKDHEVRVAILGGSAVWSGRVENSIAGHLQRFLSERFIDKQVRVLNFGRQGYVSMQELILLQRSVLSLSIDLVIIYDGYNDIWIPYAAEPMGVGHPYLYSNLETRVRSTKTINVPHVLDALASMSAVFNNLRTSGAANAKQTKARFDIDACVLEYERNLYQMASAAKSYGTSILLATQPFVGTKEPRVGQENDYLSKDDLRLVAGFYNQLVRGAEKAANRAGVFYISTVDVFDNVGEEVFSDPVHVYENIGNPIVARKLSDEIERLGILGR